MRTVIVKLETEFKYELDDEEEYQNDGIPWTDKEIKDYFAEQTVEDLHQYGISDFTDLMTVEIIDE